MLFLEKSRKEAEENRGRREMRDAPGRLEMGCPQKQMRVSNWLCELNKTQDVEYHGNPNKAWALKKKKVH